MKKYIVTILYGDLTVNTQVVEAGHSAHALGIAIAHDYVCGKRDSIHDFKVLDQDDPHMDALMWVPTNE